MSEHINGTNRDQTVLFPDTIDKYVDKENPARFINAFVDNLNLEKLGFKHSTPAATGRPSYNPKDLLKLYIYGISLTLQVIRGSTLRRMLQNARLMELGFLCRFLGLLILIKGRVCRSLRFILTSLRMMQLGMFMFALWETSCLF